MHSVSRPWWQQVTALVSLGAGGAITGLSFIPRATADTTSPASVPIRLLALEQSARPASANDPTLRSAIVNVTNYYLRVAEGKTPAEMEAIIWQHDSIDGIDHGASCAAFASLTLELAAQVVGQQSWVTGGSSYPWPLREWADVRVDPNPASPGVTSILQDAQAHQRWHPLGDGYQPLPGDWVLFDGHVEVVTDYAGGVLRTVGGDSLPNFSVNAHEYGDPLSAQGVVGFVNNGALRGAANQPPPPCPGRTALPAAPQAPPARARTCQPAARRRARPTGGWRRSPVRKQPALLSRQRPGHPALPPSRPCRYPRPAQARTANRRRGRPGQDRNVRHMAASHHARPAGPRRSTSACPALSSPSQPPPGMRRRQARWPSPDCR